VAAPSKKCREATEAWRRRGGSPAKPCKQELWNHPACSAFLEFDGLAGTPPNLGGEFQTPNCQFIHTFYERRFSLESTKYRRYRPPRFNILNTNFSPA